MPTISIETTERSDVLDMTEDVSRAIPDDADGIATVFARHTTAGVTVNEAESRLLEDLANALDGLVPDAGWAHDEIDNNADGHVRAMLVGPSVTVPVSDGQPDLGTWQSILFVECDGPRTRTIQVETVDG
ncbi:secondary thiamine-phosphate synthase enzyme YjbQ [Halapricum hydrolyticum]|uniref:Secondary thiamine-phosphate synthase enzyme YjbQ n=1 Tax=Halapricum hydrolyticum TaxID=2979991 RepID=A0AAE3LFM1_9EURY|nr:secondary thiamine-phosphate synthase enzyme YjbQ [Halapricum hydrolyticum]MCU4718956.1 secondary thiamine-phosphate synthase enzyme YjbQ [Halapricum hydrolyticum]MCU4727951.1 secondary thiamine-phosphate synthase enzyme YjbQ [Halapricum hydrolyticum]